MLLDTPPPTTNEEYAKVPGTVDLYRHTNIGRYYGVKKVRGKKKERSFGTTDRKIAERRLKEWNDGLSKVDAEVEKTTLRQLIQTFIAVTSGRAFF